MARSHELDLNQQLSRTTWRPVPPPGRGEPLALFYSFVLLPGISTAYLQTVLQRSYNSIRRYKARARHAAAQDPSIDRGVVELMANLSTHDGLVMARMRGNCQLPFWSRLAIADFVKAGFSLSSISTAFKCSPRTISNVIRNTDFSKINRALAAPQLNPPGKFRPPLGAATPARSQENGLSPCSTTPSRLRHDSHALTSAIDPTGGGNLQPGLTNNPSNKETTRG